MYYTLLSQLIYDMPSRRITPISVHVRPPLIQFPDNHNQCTDKIVAYKQSLKMFKMLNFTALKNLKFTVLKML
jgi:hypothetical protein